MINMDCDSPVCVNGRMTAKTLVLNISVVLLAAVIAMAALAGCASGSEDAARISTLSQITAQVGKYPAPEGKFFESACLVAGLKQILGADYPAYHEFLGGCGCGRLEQADGFVFADVSQPHVGGFGSMFFVDVKNEKLYLFWLKASVLDKEYQIYGDRPVPAVVLAAIAKNLNECWGHVATFKFTGEKLVIEAVNPK